MASVIILVVILSVGVHLAACNDACRYHEYDLQKDYKLTKNVIDIISLRNFMACEALCKATAKCEAFNWHGPTSTCETIDSTKNTSPGDFNTEIAWMYFEMDTDYKGKCDDSICGVGEICTSQCTKSGLKRVCEGCIEAAGMEDNRIPNNQITATNDFGASYKPSYARLNHNTFWSSHETVQEQHIQVVLNQQQYVTGVITQGKNDAWVTDYKVAFTPDDINWEFVSKTDGQPKKFEGNTDADTAVTNMFLTPILVSTIRIHPTEVYRFIHMRIEFLGCE
ncbi:lactadherin-like isoform X2 [Amphiura filiformis]|uniref:lactadherin-like isoform X2 n=1 Tax=Amphiura filiformis TaxID=82378 RepID=UPI003B21367D